MSTPGPALIHIHEDEWGMRSLHPCAARDEVRADLAASRDAGARNRDPSGIGWTDLHIIAAPSVDFRDLVSVGALGAALAPLLPTVARFHATAGSGFGAGRHDPLGSYDDDATCFGFGPTCFIKADIVEAAVAAIWFECRASDAAQRDALVAGLRAVDALAPCLVVDYWLGVEGRVGDADFLASYADLLAEKAG